MKKKDQGYILGKLIFNLLLTIVGVVLIINFLQDVQNGTTEERKKAESDTILQEIVDTLDSNSRDAEELESLFHSTNQDTLSDLGYLLTSGAFDSLATATDEERSQTFAEIMEKSGTSYMFLMYMDGTVAIAPVEGYTGVSLVDCGLLSADNEAKLLKGTSSSGEIDPVLEKNSHGGFYFYSEVLETAIGNYVLVCGQKSDILDVQFDALTDIGTVLRNHYAAEGSLLFAVNKETGEYIYFDDGKADLTGKSALTSGLSESALQGGYSGIEKINGTEYYCVSKDYADYAIICAAADTASLYSISNHGMVWSILGFLSAVGLCLAYSQILRTDSLENPQGPWMKLVFPTKKGGLYLNRSITRKAMPLAFAMSVVVFGIMFYAQTLISLSEATRQADNTVLMAEQAIYNSDVSGATIRDYYEQQYLHKAKLLAYCLEEDPSVLNETENRYTYSTYDENNNRVTIADAEGNPLTSVKESRGLQEALQENDIADIYLFDEQGHTICTSSDAWYFTLSFNPEDQSYAMREVLEEKSDELVQAAGIDELGKQSQYIGVTFHTYTTKNASGETEYVSVYDYEHQEEARQKKLEEYEAARNEALQQALAEAQEAEDQKQAEETILAAIDQVNSETGTAETDSSSASQQVTLSLNDVDLSSVQLEDLWLGNTITKHDGLFEIALNSDLMARVLDSTDITTILSGVTVMGNGFLVAFSSSDDHIVVYAPTETTIGKTAEELGIDSSVFSSDFNGFETVNGVRYFCSIRYSGGLYLCSAVPTSSLYDNRLSASIITSVAALLFSIFAVLMTAFTTADEKKLLLQTLKASRAQRKKKEEKLQQAAIRDSFAAWRYQQHTKWNESVPEDRLKTLFGVVVGVFGIYILLLASGASEAFGQDSIIVYILSGNWIRGFNVFALSACVALLVFTAFVMWVLGIVISLFTSLLGEKTRTVGHLLQSMLKYGGALAALFYGLYLLGLDAQSLLASAGIVSLIIGLGAQKLIGDILAGVFIVFEGVFRVGDYVMIGDFRGEVIDIGLRATKVRDITRNIRIFNNSEISGVTNLTREMSFCIVTFGIDYGTDLEYVEQVMEREFPAIKSRHPEIMKGPIYKGVVEMADSSVVLRVDCLAKEENIPKLKLAITRELYLMCNRNNIPIPFPHMTVNFAEEEGNPAPETVEKSPEAK